MTATLFSRSPPTLLGRRMYAEAKEDQYRSRKATRLPQLLVREQITRITSLGTLSGNGKSSELCSRGRLAGNVGRSASVKNSWGWGC